MTSIPQLDIPGRFGESRSRQFLSGMLRHPSGIFGFIIVILFIVVAIFANQIAPYNIAHQEIIHRLEASSAAHWLGTDQLGRDILSRLMGGAQIALITAFPAVIFALLAGLVIGAVAGYWGGLIDNIVIVFTDTLKAFPALILALALMALLGPSEQNVIFVIAFTFMPDFARVTRAMVLSEKERQFIEAERNFGASDFYIIFIHIIPNILAPLIILLAMNIPAAISVEAGLSFLGLGVVPPAPSWGIILSDGFKNIFQAPWPVIWAGLTLAIVTLGFTLFGEELRDFLDPRLSGTRRDQ